MKYARLETFIKLLSVAILMSTVAILWSGRFLGYDLISSRAAATPVDTVSASFTFTTEGIADDVRGFGGATPLSITVTDGKITDIKTLRNAETPDFFERVEKELMPTFIGMTPEQVLESDVDAITGATYSSRAIKETMRLAAAHILDVEAEQAEAESPLTAAFWASLIVVLAAAIIPIFTRNKIYRVIQLVLNVAILGFWAGTFLSYSLIMNYLSNGVNWLVAIVPLIMLVVALIYPLFGRKSHYCTWVCPLGSLQDLAGKCNKNHKLTLSARVTRYLEIFRDVLWAVLMLLMFTGVWFDWMNYELFTAFIVNQAALGVTIAAIIFVVLSVFVNRPYCRFVCPTGYIIRFPQTTNKTKHHE